jgi:protein TonB
MNDHAPSADLAVVQSSRRREGDRAAAARGASTGERAAAVLGAILFHAALFAALVFGLRFEPIRRVGADLAVFDVLEPPPPPAAEAPRPEPQSAQAPSSPAKAPAPVVAPQPKVPLPAPPPVAAAPATGEGRAAEPGAGGAGAVSGEGVDGDGNGAGGAMHAQRRSGSLRDRDYPPAARREGAEGIVHVRFTVGADGRVDGCTVTRSSGHAALDTTTCRLIEQRFRYHPARDSQGRPVPETISLFYQWGLRR